jgi:hypothetical protein
MVMDEIERDNTTHQRTVRWSTRAAAEMLIVLAIRYMNTSEGADVDRAVINDAIKQVRSRLAEVENV